MHTDAKPGMAVVVDGRVLRETFDIKGRLRRNPYGMVAGALSIGFALGGGLFTRVASRILGAGLRIGLMAALPILQKQIVEAFTKPKSDTTKETDQ
jgi:hypothetical protein